jgi:hypothetical protein
MLNTITDEIFERNKAAYDEAMTLADAGPAACLERLRELYATAVSSTKRSSESFRELTKFTCNIGIVAALTLDERYAAEEVTGLCVDDLQQFVAELAVAGYCVRQASYSQSLMLGTVERVQTQTGSEEIEFVEWTIVFDVAYEIQRKLLVQRKLLDRLEIAIRASRGAWILFANAELLNSLSSEDGPSMIGDVITVRDLMSNVRLGVDVSAAELNMLRIFFRGFET